MCRVGDEDGVPLEGGYQADVRRVADRVLRPSHRTTRYIDLLLRHLRSVGFQGAPASFGLDGRGRHALEYLEGYVANAVPPDHVWSDQVLIATARLIRRYHDAALSFLVPESWTPVVHQQELPDVSGDEEVVCHNDLAPWNTLFRDHRPAAFIDWDSAAPGTRAWDVAFALWHWTPLYPERRRAEVGAAMVTDLPSRVSAFLKAYGFTPQPVWLAVVLQRQRATYEELRRRSRENGRAASLWRSAEPALNAEMAFLQELRPELERRLSAST
jgi:hypothetical protein